MSEINDGGPASCESGMSLRDYFAAKAVAALIAEPEWNDQPSLTFRIGPKKEGSPETNYAMAAYRIADAMIAARESSK